MYCGKPWVGRAVKTLFEISSGAPSFGTRLDSARLRLGLGMRMGSLTVHSVGLRLRSYCGSWSAG